MAELERELTYGENAVGISFNPSANNRVDTIKTLYSKIIDVCNIVREDTASGEVKRMMSVAITEAQTAQMWAVKGITWKD